MPIFRLVDTIDGAIERGTDESEKEKALAPDLNKALIQSELDEIMQQANEFVQLEPDCIMTLCGGYLARLTELWIRILRVEEARPELKDLRTQEIRLLLELMKSQYRIASRMLTVRQIDVELSR